MFPLHSRRDNTCLELKSGIGRYIRKSERHVEVSFGAIDVQLAVEAALLAFDLLTNLLYQDSQLLQRCAIGRISFPCEDKLLNLSTGI